MPVNILGIDPGFDRVGYAVGHWTGNKLEILAGGLIQTDKKQDLHQRYKQILEDLSLVLKQWRPQSCHIEKVFFSKNQKTAMQVSEARGIIIGLLIAYQIQIKEFSPQEVKLAATGYGNADKKAVAKMVNMQVSLPQDIDKLDDVIDAVALLLAR